MGSYMIYFSIGISFIACFLSWIGFPSLIYQTSNIDFLYFGITILMVGLHSTFVRNSQTQGNVRWESVLLMAIVVGAAIPVVL